MPSKRSVPKDPIKHVIVLMLENRSFDHMLGCMQSVYPDLDGIRPKGKRRVNQDKDGTKFPQEPGASRQVLLDPNHEYQSVVAQLAGGNSGFVTNYQHYFPSASPEQLSEVMRYHDLDTLPALHALAKHFTVCDHWFSSLPGPTWPNRLFVHSGTSLGMVTMPNGIFHLNLHWYDQTTLYDRLNAAGVTWRIYFGDVPQSLVLVDQLEPENAINYHHLAHFFTDVAGKETEFPQYCFLEPAYNQPGANDDHPPHDLLAGQKLIADVYNALRQKDELWSSTLLVVLYDEHGGFYDHVSPPATIPPDHHQDEFTFDRLGVRVPAVLVSPYVKTGVLSTVFDHTSLLRYLTDKWKLGSLGQRTALAASFASSITSNKRSDTPETIPALPAAEHTQASLGAAAPVQKLSDHQQALVGLSHVLETMSPTDPALVAARSQQQLSGPQSQIDISMDRVDDFLRNSARFRAR